MNAHRILVYKLKKEHEVPLNIFIPKEWVVWMCAAFDTNILEKCVNLALQGEQKPGQQSRHVMCSQIRWEDVISGPGPLGTMGNMEGYSD